MEHLEVTDQRLPLSGNGWMSEAELDEYLKNSAEPDFFKNIIFGKNIIKNLQPEITLVIGAPGTGKTRGVITPNLLQMNASYIVTDSYSDLRYNVGHTLKKNGYIVRILNLAQPNKSNHYNPLCYITNESDLDSFTELLTKNSNEQRDDYWVSAEKSFFAACTWYLLHHQPDKSKQTLSGLLDMLQSLISENGNVIGSLQLMFKNVPHDSVAYRNYNNVISSASDNTLYSVITSCISKLSRILSEDVISMTNDDEMQLDTLTKKKTILFVIPPTTNTPLTFMAPLMYAQAFEALKQSSKNEVPVIFMMDEFANYGKLPNIKDMCINAKRNNLSLMFLVQSISQILMMYPYEKDILFMNCDNILFLGSTELETCQWLANALPYSDPVGNNLINPNDLLHFKNEFCIASIPSRKLVCDFKYDVSSHPNYEEVEPVTHNTLFD